MIIVIILMIIQVCDQSELCTSLRDVPYTQIDSLLEEA